MININKFSPIKKYNRIISRNLFNYKDPFLLDQQLTDDDKSIKDLTQQFSNDYLLPKIVSSFRNENFDRNIRKIEKPSDTDSYELSLDKEIEPDSTDEKYVKKFDSKTLRVKIIHQKILGIAKSPLIKEFLDSNTSNHKIFIFDGISDKAKSTLMSIPNTEVFTEAFLMINIVEHIDSPRYELISEEESKQVLETYIVKKKELPKILTTDPIVSYFNLKRGQIIRIIRCSEQSGFSVIYRIVAKGAS
jgi:DNA-directed RNA polymerase subunit H (RpoH/RPB5)